MSSSAPLAVFQAHRCPSHSALCKCISTSRADDSHFSECLELVKKHKLYRLAMDLFQNEEAKRKQVLHQYAEYLASRERHHEAGLSTRFPTRRNDPSPLISLPSACSL